MSLHGQTLVLTGASSGIGEVAAYRLASEGARLCLVARRADELARVAERIRADGGDARIYPANLADAGEIETLVERLLADEPRIDALINNAARSIRRPILESLDRLHDYQRTMQLNYFGAVQLTLGLLPRFLDQGRGHVVVSSTMSTQVPIPLFSAYLGSKAALESFARSLYAELGPRGISSTVVHFPMVRTPMSSRTRLYKHLPMASVEEAAEWLVRAVRERPARVASPFGTAGALALTALPGPINRAGQRVFHAMDRYLAWRAARDAD